MILESLSKIPQHFLKAQENTMEKIELVKTVKAAG